MPGKSIAGVTIGQRIRTVVRRLGAPSETRSAEGMVLYLFPRFGITVYGAGEVVRAVSTTNSVLRTRERVGVGSSLAEVREVYGDQSQPREVEGAQGIAYDRLRIAFGIERQSVVIVLVY